jgi:uncharacterized repeat protein (TIGR01451 family)
MNKIQVKSRDKEVNKWLPQLHIAACVFILLTGNIAQAQTAITNSKDTIQPSAQAQIKSILAEKSSRTTAEAKLDSNLLYGLRAVSPATKGSLQTQPQFIQDFVRNNFAADLTVKVTIRAKLTVGLLAALNAASASEISPFSHYDAVTARIPVDQLLAISARPEVRFIEVFVPGTTNRYNMTPAELRVWQTSTAKFPLPIVNVGAATSQGVAAHAADKVQQTGINGTGVKVCVLSDGVDSLEERQESGDLPVVDVLAGQAGSGDEGTAMLEIIHDMAPNATLGFATASGDAQMATNIQMLRNSPHLCNIIVDDVTFFVEPPFQEGIIAQAVSTVTANGASFFSSAANSGSLAKGTSGTWEGDFVNGGNFILNGSFNGTMHSFSGTNNNTITQIGNAYLLTWGDSQSGSNNDYDLYILDSTLTTVLGWSNNTQNGTQIPFEWLPGSATIPVGSKIIVLNYQGVAQVRALRLDTQRGRLSINTNGNTYGHNGGVNTISIGAVSAVTAGGGAFVGGEVNPVETFSSDGPRKLFYTPAGAAITPGNILFGTNGGTLLNKVDLAASDCVTTTTPGFTPFCGTSAAAPHAAAIAALIKSAKPSLTGAQIKNALNSTALDIEAFGYDYNAGNGLIMANASVRSVLISIGVAKAFSPASIAIGGTSTLTVTLANTNSVALQNVAMTDTYPANLKNAPTPSAQFTGTGCAGTISATVGGGSLALSSATIPASGTCYLRVNVTSTVVGFYADTSGNVTTPLGLNSAAARATLSVTAIIAKPDFIVTGTTLTPTSPIVNSTFSAAVTIKNQGTAAGTVGKLQLWANQVTSQACSAVGDKSVSIGSLAAGASTTVTITGISSGVTGNKTLRTFVDGQCATSETNETNNQSTKTYTVIPPPIPDFVVTGVTLSPTSPAFKGIFSAIVTVKNQGTVAGNGGYIDVWANQTTAQSCQANGNSFASVGTLAAGASKTLTVSGLRAGVIGTKTLRVFVDSYCQTAEVKEDNNQFSFAYTVGNIDLVITSIVVNPAIPKANTSFSASVVVKNQGTVAGNGGYLDVWGNQSAV